MSDALAQKKMAAEAALDEIKSGAILGVGTGTTVECLIELLPQVKSKIEMTVSSSDRTTALLKKLNIPVCDLAAVDRLDLYIDGADEVSPALHMIKGGGGALTREKIVACVAKQFVCIVDQSKQVPVLGQFPLAIEVIPMARSYVGRELVKLGGQPNYREGFVTDNGNIILDVFLLDYTDPFTLEAQLNNITGVVCHGLFVSRSANKVLIGTEQGVKTVTEAHSLV